MLSIIIYLILVLNVGRFHWRIWPRFYKKDIKDKDHILEINPDRILLWNDSTKISFGGPKTFEMEVGQVRPKFKLERINSQTTVRRNLHGLVTKGSNSVKTEDLFWLCDLKEKKGWEFIELKFPNACFMWLWLLLFTCFWTWFASTQLFQAAK